jgi:hypothetical protein
LSQSLIDNRKIEIFKPSALSGAFAYRHLSGALLLVMAVAAMLSIPFRGERRPTRLFTDLRWGALSKRARRKE